MATEKNDNALTDFSIVSELFLALNGEPCCFTYLNADGSRFIPAPATKNSQNLPSKLAYKLDKITKISTSVRNINIWEKSCNTPDSIRRAFINALLAVHNNFLESVNKMRVQHLCHQKPCSLDQILSFIYIWHDRISYINSLINAIMARRVLEDEEIRSGMRSPISGMEAMNLAFRELSIQCIADWKYKILEDILTSTSRTLHEIVSAWLLQGELPRDVPWMVGKEAAGELRKGNTSRNDSISSANIQTDAANFEERVHKALIPCSMQSSPELFEEILEIGRKVHFLKELRGQTYYDYKLAERRKLIESELCPDRVWFDIHERGQLCITLAKMAEIVRGDLIDQLMNRHRLIEHLRLIHTYFFMLRGDLTVSLGNEIMGPDNKTMGDKIVSPAKSCKTTKSALIAESLLSDAMKGIAPLASFSDLVPCLKVDKMSSSKTSTRYFEDHFKLGYKPPTTIRSILDPHVLRYYQHTFNEICAPLLLLSFRLDAVALRFSHATKLLKGATELYLRHIHCRLMIIRGFVKRVLNYVFNDVLWSGSVEILTRMRAETDLHQLLRTHKAQLSAIAKSLFLNKTEVASKNVKYVELFQYVNSIRVFVGSLDSKVSHVEKVENGAEKVLLLSLEDPAMAQLMAFDPLFLADFEISNKSV